jgi:hypothetical protein
VQSSHEDDRAATPAMFNSAVDRIFEAEIHSNVEGEGARPTFAVEASPESPAERAAQAGGGSQDAGFASNQTPAPRRQP